MSVAQGRQILELKSKLGQLVNDSRQFWKDQIESVTLEDEIGIVGAVARGSTIVNDTSSLWSNLAKCMNMCHPENKELVTAFFF